MSDAEEQCRALTEGGERCSRPAQENGFCYQHDSSDETIDNETTAEADERKEDDVSQESEATEEADSDDESASAEQNGEFDVMEVRGTIEDVASDLVGHPLDGIIEITAEDDGWEVVVEMVERSSIPDTQDILGQYAVSLDESGDVTEYRLRERYRRGDDQER